MPYPGPAAAARASSPMKKSRSSVPRLACKCPPGPAPPVKKEGLFATAGRPDPEPPAPPVGPLEAIAVGNTNEGESLPAKPRDVSIVALWTRSVEGASYQASSSPYRWSRRSVCDNGRSARRLQGSLLVHDNGRGLGRHICGCCC